MPSPIRVLVQVDGKEYVSILFKSKDLIEEMENLLEYAAKGDLSYLKLPLKNGDHIYFNKQVLTRSIITTFTPWYLRGKEAE